MSVSALSTAATAAELLSAYRPGSSSLFASPRGTLLAEGTHTLVRPTRLDDLSAQVDAALRDAMADGHDVGAIVGAVPFDPAAPAHLVVPHHLRRAGPLPAVPHVRRPAEGTPFTVVPDPEPRRYANSVAEAITRLRGGALTKVVLARSLKLTAPAGLDVGRLVSTLAGRDPGGYTFAIDIGDSGGEARTLLGASPELLVSRSGSRIVANPIAGSAARAADPAEDARRAVALLASAKDRHEHEVVVDAVAATLDPLCTDISVPVEPSLVGTGSMWHLSTRITATVGDPSLSALALATRLHPTPAVCGVPVDRAHAAIAELEPFDRGFYAGVVGWGDASGDGEWVVTIRCGVAEGNRLRLYAGAGVVADSTPESELAETTTKFGTLLAALGLSHV